MGSPSHRHRVVAYSVRLAPRALLQLEALGHEERSSFTRRMFALADRLADAGGSATRTPGGKVQELDADGVVGLYEVDHDDAVITVLNIACESVSAPVRQKAAPRPRTPPRPRKEGAHARD